MAIRIESLPSEESFISTTVPLSASEAYSNYLPEISQIYGGTSASIAAMPPPTEFPSPIPANRPQPVVPSGNWSTALQTMLDRPPATLPNRFVVGGVMFCAAFATWANMSQVDEIGRAQGRLVPQGETFKVNPVAAGKISKVLVKEGQTVKAGQIVAELDDDLARNRVDALRQEQNSHTKELRQTESLIEKTRSEAQTQFAIANAEISAQEAAISQSQAKIKSQETSITQTQERATTNQQLLSALQSDAEAQKERMARLKYLVDEGALAREQLYQAQQSFGDRQRTITQQAGDIQQAFVETQRLRADLQQVIAESQQLRAGLARKYAEAQSTQLRTQQTIQQLLVQRTQLLAKMQQNEKQQEAAKSALNQLKLRAPVNGTVLAMNVRNEGEVVQPGQTIAEMAPEKAPLILAAALPTREAGFVKVGDTAQVKFDAYPYQEYGIVSGKVISISPDVKLDNQLGAVYRVEIQIDRDTKQTQSRRIQLKAGQTASAEIVVRQRRVVDLFLDPIRQLQQNGIKL